MAAVDSYTVASGKGVYGGMADPTGLPAWVPDPGTFKNISLNTLADVRPAGWPTGDTLGPFSDWGSGDYVKDYSALGGYAIHDSGHAALASDALWCGVPVFDVSTRLWAMRNTPAAPMDGDNAHYNTYGESTVSATAGHTRAPHTYGGIMALPTANGGGSKGSLLRISFASGESYYGSPTHKFDLSSATAPATRVIDAMGGTTYPMAAADYARNGFWYLSNNGNGPLAFYSFADWSVTTYPGIQFNEYGDGFMAYVPGRDCLVCTVKSGGGGVNLSVYVCPIVGGVPQGFVAVTQSGTGPADKRSGIRWSTILSCLVAYEAAGSYAVHRLTLPSGSLTAGTWAWTSETLTGVGGATPCRNTSGQDTGAWGRFVEVPAARCFLWCDSVTGAVQAWRLQGM